MVLQKIGLRSYLTPYRSQLLSQDVAGNVCIVKCKVPGLTALYWKENSAKIMYTECQSRNGMNLKKLSSKQIFRPR